MRVRSMRLFSELRALRVSGCQFAGAPFAANCRFWAAEMTLVVRLAMSVAIGGRIWIALDRRRDEP